MDQMIKTFVEEEALLNDAFRMAVSVYEWFPPPSLWAFGVVVPRWAFTCRNAYSSWVVESDHISIRTSYAGLPEYQKSVDDPSSIRVHGLQYLLENLNADDRLLLVDDVFNSGYSIEAVITELQQKLRLNMPSDVRVATPYFKPAKQNG